MPFPTPVYSRLPDSSWGVLVPHQATRGSQIVVIKRSGERKTVTLGELVSSGPNGWLFKIDTATPAISPVADAVDLTRIMDLFDRARQHLRYPAIVLSVPASGETVRLSVAGTTARVPGSINVAAQDEHFMGRRRWYGRILPTGQFEQRAGSASIAARLRQFAANPVQVASEHGQLTGRCCFCNRPLEDERSTAVGYGPICAGHFDLPWGDRPASFAEPIRQPSGEDDGLADRQPALPL